MLEEYFLVAPLGLEDYALREARWWAQSLTDSFLDIRFERRKGGVDLEISPSDFSLILPFLKVPTRVLKRIGGTQVVKSVKEFSVVIDRLKSDSITPTTVMKFHFKKSRLNYTYEKRLKYLIGQKIGTGEEFGGALHFDFFEDNLKVSQEVTRQALYHRGWRYEVGKAPIRENLASAMTWFVLEQVGRQALKKLILVDPFAGSGTILIEGRLLFQPTESLVAAESPRGSENSLLFSKAIGIELDHEQLKGLTQNLSNLGEIVASDCALARIDDPQDILVMTNLPYGERVKGSGEASWKALCEFCVNNQVKFVLALDKRKKARREIPGFTYQKSLKFSNGGIPVEAQFLARD
jgi:hypothetical protein